MIGQGGGDQGPLFCSLNLNDHVPADHSLRGMDFWTCRIYAADIWHRSPVTPELASKWCLNSLNRRIVRTPFEAVREVARGLRDTARYRQAHRDRNKVEMLFAPLKRILRLDRLRGRSGAKDEFPLTGFGRRQHRANQDRATR